MAQRSIRQVLSMAKEKKRFYNIQSLLETKATYLLLLGERTNGKSYQAKYTALWEAWHEADYEEYLSSGKIVPKERWQFAYLRRWDREIKILAVNDYFTDMSNAIKEITGDEATGIECFQSIIYFTKYDPIEDKIKKIKEIGRPFSLHSSQHYKSRMFPKIGNIVMEEVIPDDGMYLPEECKHFFSVVSTIARRDKIRVMMVGNKMNRVCPYFTEWCLKPVLKQKEGTIDIYRQNTDGFDDNGNPIVVTIAVEMCEEVGQQNRMFFGQRSKSIVHGTWDTDEYPHLEEDIDDYDEYYRLCYIHREFAFMVKLLRSKRNEILLFVYPFTGDTTKIDRRVSNEFSLSPLVTPKLTEVTKYDKLVKQLIDNKKICFSDNLTGTDFYNTIKERGGL